jgi:trimethylamine--corrinoid protein Co-methyltransferase
MQVKILEDHQIEKIHLKTLEILENTGVYVPHEEILSRFKRCGAIVDSLSNVVKIPSSLVMELISKAGKPTPLDNDIKNDLEKIIEDAKRNFSK